MKRVYKHLFMFLFIFVLSLSLVFVTNKTYMISVFKGETVNLEDVTKNSFVENGTIFSTSNYFKLVNMGHNIRSNAIICFSENDDNRCDSTDKKFTLAGSDFFVVPAYDNLFDNGIKYNGWKLSNGEFGEPQEESNNFYGYYFIFTGSNDYSMYEVDDNYSINSKCSDSSAPSYTWYKNLDFEFVYDVSIDEKYYDYHFDDDMHIWDFEHFSDSSSSGFTVSFELDAKAGDEVMFDYSVIPGYINAYHTVEANVDLNGERVHFNKIGYYNFSTFILPITTSGKQKISLTVYEYKTNTINNLSLFVKDLRLLSVVNRDASLEHTGISDGESLYSTAICENGEVLGSMVTFNKSTINNDDLNGVDDNNKDDNEDTQNPDTGDFVNIMIIFVIILVFILIYKFYNKFNNIKKI